MTTAIAITRHYGDRYTWSHQLTDHVIAHKDGAVSLLIEWAGIDCELMTTAEKEAAWSNIYVLLGKLPVGYCAEFHLWRERDSRLADEYLANNSRMVRAQTFGAAVRESIAQHLADFGQTNELGIVLTKISPKKRFGAKRALIDQAREALALEAFAKTLLPNLNAGRIVSGTDYIQRILQNINRAYYQTGGRLRVDPQQFIADQVLSSAPNVRDRMVDMDGLCTKVLLVYLYPDTQPGWFLGLANLQTPLHIAHIVRPIDSKSAMRASEKASQLSESTLGRRGEAVQSQSIKDQNDFRQFVAANKLPTFNNAYVIHLYGSPDELAQHTQEITDLIASQGGQVRDNDYVQLPYFRCAQPGQGYLAPLLRPDHAWQVGDMLPVQAYRQGDRSPESLRLGRAGQLVGFGLTNQPVSHGFTVAITGGGKGVDKVATIAETFPLGLDWYILEIGGSYRWLVEALGGVYNVVDPKETVINPLPPFSVVDPADAFPLDVTLASVTLNSLAFLLTGGKRTTLDIFEQAAAEAALQLLYALPDDSRQAPTLPDLLVELERLDLELKEQNNAAHLMGANLHSFLDTSEGRIFAKQDNLILSDGISGIDLKEVQKATPLSLKFYVVFAALRFKSLAFARRNLARFLIDELHVFVGCAPDVVGRLASELSRMGRKENTSLDLVTQDIAEIDAIEKAVLNQMPLRSLLYRTSDWDEIAERINMPAGPLAAWRDLPYPLSLPWRPGLRSVGNEYYNLYLSFPEMLLDLADTSPNNLDLKDKIGKETNNIFERLRRFREEKRK